MPSCPSRPSSVLPSDAVGGGDVPYGSCFGLWFADRTRSPSAQRLRIRRGCRGRIPDLRADAWASRTGDSDRVGRGYVPDGSWFGLWFADRTRSPSAQRLRIRVRWRGRSRERRAARVALRTRGTYHVRLLDVPCVSLFYFSLPSLTTSSMLTRFSNHHTNIT